MSLRRTELGVEDFKRANPSRESPAAEEGGDHQPSQLTSSVQARLDMEIEERKQERERYERRIEELHDVLKRTQEGHERAMRLIEDRSQPTNDWEGPLKALQSQVANQEKAQQEFKEHARKRISKLQQELIQERSKSWLVKLLKRE